MIKTLVIVTCVMFCMTAEVFAGSNADAKVAVHVLPYDCQRACNRKFPEIAGACDIQTTHEGCGDIDFFPVFYNLTGYRGFEYGVVWPGGYSCVYTVCSYTHIGDIMWSGDGTAQCWADCRQDPVVIPGWGWITVDGPGQVCVVPNPMSGEIVIGDCDIQLDTVRTSFCAGVCGATGDDPCKFVDQATVPTTWGSIKGIFR